MLSNKQISLIGAPVDIGAGRRGVDMGPSALRHAGLRDRLISLGYSVIDEGNVNAPLAETLPLPPANDKLRYLEPLRSFFQALAEKVSDVAQSGRFPLIMGGDHSLSLGSINGSAKNGNSFRKLGVIWIDAHGDFNTHETTLTGNIHGMPLAALAGLGTPTLTHLMGVSPVINPQSIALVGVRDLDPLEKVLLRQAGVNVFTMHDIDRHGMDDIMSRALDLCSAGNDGLHISFDMDVLDPREVPGVGTPVPAGITLREAHLAMELVHTHGNMLSMDLVEINPILDSNNLTAKVAVELIASALGETIF